MSPIWFALVIPFIVAFIAFICFARKICWAEVVVPIIFTILLVIIIKCSSETALTLDREWWTTYIVEANYYEPWTEEWDEYIPPTYDEKGKMTSAGRWEHHKQYHTAKWEFIDNQNQEFSCSQSYYKHLVELFENEKEINLWHSNQTSIGDGDQWTTKYKKDVIIPITTIHNYTNKIQASRSVFRFPEVKDKAGLYEYPEINDVLKCRSILGKSPDEADKKLCVQNALLGHTKQVRIWMLIYQNQPIQTAINQESYWQGGNKNELNVCISLDKDNNIQWVYVFSWTDEQIIKSEIRSFIEKQKRINYDAIIDYIADEVNQKWKRKQFKDFDFLTVDVPSYIVVLTYIIVLTLNCGWFMFAICNDVNIDDDIDEILSKLRIR